MLFKFVILSSMVVAVTIAGDYTLSCGIMNTLGRQQTPDYQAETGSKQTTSTINNFKHRLEITIFCSYFRTMLGM